MSGNVVDFGVFTPEEAWVLVGAQVPQIPNTWPSQMEEVREYANRMLRTVEGQDASIEFLVQWNEQETIWCAEWRGEGPKASVRHSEVWADTRLPVDRTDFKARLALWSITCKRFNVDERNPSVRPRPAEYGKFNNN